MGAGVGVAVGVGEGEGAGVNGMPGIGVAAGAPGGGEGEGEDVTGGLVAGGAGGLTWGRAAAADAMTHPARITAPKSGARGFTP